MKKIAVLVVFVVFVACVLVGCGSQKAASETVSASAAPKAASSEAQAATGQTEAEPQQATAAQIVAAFVKEGLPLSNITVYTEETDINEKLGRPGEYIGKVNWADTRYPDTMQDDPELGTIEVFKTEEDLNDRKSYLEDIFEKMPMMEQYMYVSGLALMRLDFALTPSEAEEYDKVFQSGEYVSEEEATELLDSNAASENEVSVDYLSWKADDWNSASDDEKNSCAKAGAEYMASAMGKDKSAIDDDFVTQFKVSLDALVLSEDYAGKTIKEILDEVISEGTAAETTNENEDNTFDCDDFTATYISHSVEKDYEGNPTLKVVFEYTNKSNETQSFIFQSKIQVFQNGVELDTAISLDDDKEYENAYKDIKPNATVTVARLFKLEDQSNIEMEVSELLDFDGENKMTKVLILSE